MDTDAALTLMLAWDNLNSAARRILVAQPWQMTEAASRLDQAREEMQEVMNKTMRKVAATDEQSTQQEEPDRGN
jgi:hypothetical protein